MEEMTFKKAIAICFKKSFDFSGRAGRSEYWYFTLFNWVLSTPILIITRLHWKHPLYIAWCIIMFFPSTTVSVRRLHDTGKSGILYLVFCFLIISNLLIQSLIPDNTHYGHNGYTNYLVLLIANGIAEFVLGIVMLVFFCTESEAGINKYGNSQKYDSKHTIPNTSIMVHNSNASPINETTYNDTKALISDETVAELQNLKGLFEKELIDETEYKAKKTQILGLHST